MRDLSFSNSALAVFSCFGATVCPGIGIVTLWLGPLRVRVRIRVRVRFRVCVRLGFLLA